MKKFIASVIVCGFAVAMVACGGKKVDEAKALADSLALATADSIAAATAAAAVDTVKVAVDSAAVK